MLTGCGQERLLNLQPVPSYWSAHSFASNEYSDQEVPVQQKNQFLQTCLQKKTVSLPKSYRTLQSFGIFFTLNDLEIAPFPTEIVYLAQGDQMYLACRSPKTQELRVHPVKASEHPWVRLTENPDQIALQAPVSVPLTEEQQDQHVSVNQAMSADNEFAKDLKPFHMFQLPMAGQLLFVMTESGQEHIIRNIPLSSLHQQGEFYLVSRRQIDGSTSRSLTFSRDGWDMADRQIMTADKFTRIKTKQHSLPKTLPVNQTVPFVTLQGIKKERVAEEKILSIRYQPVYRPVKEYQIEDEPTRGVTAYFHPTMRAFEKAKLSEMVILPNKLSRAITEELKAVTLEEPQGTRSPFSYMTLLEYGNTQTFNVYLKKRANKTDLYLQDQRTKKSARLSGELARQVSEKLAEP
ncbi:hypothetical protein [Exiguobacterium artemiae]|uniref:hypothetical protein n=1 Tax=Exiguobacterium artemiae TaxID=340145 RepID=UPI000B098CA5|nr:hypothetical protein [Exiguobacterium sibiricum]